jgi:hypothetical protein
LDSSDESSDDDLGRTDVKDTEMDELEKEVTNELKQTFYPDDTTEKTQATNGDKKKDQKKLNV